MKKLTKSALLELIREQIDDLAGLTGTMTRTQQAAKELEKSKGIRSGGSMKDVTTRERSILQSVEDALTKVAEEGDLNKYRSQLETLLQRMLRNLTSKEGDQE
tara:strand:+ start:5105 stop:5413 length:309 start_codon:yes stop_codon:yes gene_type:complete